MILYSPEPISAQSIKLTWSAYAGPAFDSYHVYRSTVSGVGLNHTLVAVVSNAAQTNWTDTGLMAGHVYYYRVYLMNTNNTLSGSNEASTRTLGAPIPWTEDFENDQQIWTLEGTWTRLAGAGRNGSAALASAPGDYPHNTNMSAYAAFNPSGMNWPVLTFWERSFIGNGDWAYLEVSGNDGASWTRVYGTYGTRTNWMRRVIDLSQWKNSPMIWLRFRLTSDSAVAGAGWHIDDLSIENWPDTPVTSFAERFESGLDQWLDGGWTISTNSYAGAGSATDVGGLAIPSDSYRALVYGASLALSNVPNPTLTYWYKGTLWGYSYYRTQVSTNGGLSWVDLHSINYDFDQPAWQRHQISLAAYTNLPIRLRFLTFCQSSTPQIGMYLDNIGVGGPTPGAPTLLSPAMYESVPALRPTLVVGNAQDAQHDPLTYSFEVYADAALSNFVAQVPAVSAGATSTAWQVDVDLPNNAQYWWRCRVSDGSNVGPWMATATFYVNETNAPPALVQIASPPKGATLRTSAGILSWYPATDPDVGDEIIQYHIQIDDDPAFGAPEVNAIFAAPIPPPQGPFVTIARPLYTLNGYENLGMISNYFWRIRAQDSRYLWSGWSVGGHWFIYGVPPPNAASIVRNANGSITFTWDVGTENWYIQWTPSLSGGWQTVAGPLGVNTWTFTPDPLQTSGFYRIVGE